MTNTCERTGREIHLEVDGGVKIDNIRQIAEAGADTFRGRNRPFSATMIYHDVIAQMRAELAKVNTWEQRDERTYGRASCVHEQDALAPQRSFDLDRQ